MGEGESCLAPIDYVIYGHCPLDSPVWGITLRRLRSPKAILKKRRSNASSIFFQVGHHVLHGPSQSSVSLPRSPWKAHFWPWRWWKIKDKWRERKKANIHFSKSCSALKTILGIFWQILQISSVISEHLLWCFCYILSLIYIFVIDILLSFYCKIVKKSKTKTCLFVDPSESGKIRGS